MRILLVLLALAAGGLAAWWVLRGSEAPEDGLGPAGAGLRPARQDGEPAPALLAAARIALTGPADRGLPVDPEAGPWETFLLDLEVKPGARVTGAALLTAIGKRLYVRAQTQADLDALNAHVFEGLEGGSAIPLQVAVTMIERAGWRVGVREPRFLFRPATPEELQLERDLAAETPR